MKIGTSTNEASQNRSPAWQTEAQGTSEGVKQRKRNIEERGGNLTIRTAKDVKKRGELGKGFLANLSVQPTATRGPGLAVYVLCSYQLLRFSRLGHNLCVQVVQSGGISTSSTWSRPAKMTVRGCRQLPCIIPNDFRVRTVVAKCASVIETLGTKVAH
jgi:hypothetical protein